MRELCNTVGNLSFLTLEDCKVKACKGPPSALIELKMKQKVYEAILLAVKYLSKAGHLMSCWSSRWLLVTPLCISHDNQGFEGLWGGVLSELPYECMRSLSCALPTGSHHHTSTAKEMASMPVTATHQRTAPTIHASFHTQNDLLVTA